MVNRTYTPQPPSECISVNVTSGLRNGTYQILLRHRFNGSSEISSLNITVHPFTSGSHTEDNALFLQHLKYETQTWVSRQERQRHVWGRLGVSKVDSQVLSCRCIKFLYINSKQDMCCPARNASNKNRVRLRIVFSRTPSFCSQRIAWKST
uniref:Putative secreted histamine binding protein of 19.7 kDa n=1 Tax=Ixodes ricinus TaxID=34613 RepID=V5HBU1_IXORI